MLPLVSGLVEYSSGKHRPHGTFLDLFVPTAVRLSLYVGFCYSQMFWYEMVMKRKSYTF